MASYATIRNDVGIALRNALRTDSTILSLLGLTVGNAKNHIFYKRPVDEQHDFNNPRIVIEPDISQGLGYIGNNPDGQTNGSLSFTLLIWVDDKPMALASQVEDRCLNLFNAYQVSLDLGFCFVDLRNSNQVSDPDKKNTIQISGQLNVDINGGR